MRSPEWGWNQECLSCRRRRVGRSESEGRVSQDEVRGVESQGGAGDHWVWLFCSGTGDLLEFKKGEWHFSKAPLTAVGGQTAERPA